MLCYQLIVLYLVIYSTVVFEIPAVFAISIFNHNFRYHLQKSGFYMLSTIS
jgi:hypothetical protein